MKLLTRLFSVAALLFAFAASWSIFKSMAIYCFPLLSILIGKITQKAVRYQYAGEFH